MREWQITKVSEMGKDGDVLFSYVVLYETPSIISLDQKRSKMACLEGWTPLIPPFLLFLLPNNHECQNSSLIHPPLSFLPLLSNQTHSQIPTIKMFLGSLGPIKQFKPKQNLVQTHFASVFITYVALHAIFYKHTSTLRPIHLILKTIGIFWRLDAVPIIPLFKFHDLSSSIPYT